MHAGLGLTRNRHGNQFHTRICVPKDLAPLLGRREMRLSLGTEQRREAIRAARLVHAGKIPAFDQMRAKMDKNNSNPTPEQQAEARKRLLALIQQRQQVLPAADPQEEAAEAARYASAADEQKEDRELMALLDRDPVFKSAFVEVMRDQMAARQAAEADTSSALGALQAVEAGRQAAIQVAATNINKATEAEQRSEKSAATIGRMTIDHASERARMATEHSAQLANVSIALASSGTAMVPDRDKADLPSVHISELLEAYETHPSTEGKDGRKQYQAEVKAFVRSMGDMLIRDISAPVMRKFLEIERELPTGLTRRINDSPDKKIEEIVSIAFSKGAKKVKLSTATQRVTRIATLFRWALKGDEPKKWGFVDGANPGEDFMKRQLSKKEIKEATNGNKTSRRPFSEEDLIKIFTGAKSEPNGRYGYGVKRFKKHCQYWLPLLALFTGARANELAQLRVTDIEQDKDGVWLLNFNEKADSDGVERKKLKNSQSERRIPIHSKLLDLGFIDYVNQLKKEKHWCLFQELKPENASPKRQVWNSTMTNWYPRYQEACGVVDNEEGAAVFHNFRHTMSSRLMNEKINEYVINVILGHEQKTQSTQTYGKLSMSAVLEDLERVSFPAAMMDALPRWRDIKFQDGNKDCPVPQPAKLDAAGKRGGPRKSTAA